MSDYEERTENSETTLVDQLGTDPKLLARGLVDKVKLTYLVGTDKIPDQFKPALFFLVQNAKKGIPVNIQSAPESPSWSDHILNREKVREFNEYHANKEMGLE